MRQIIGCRIYLETTMFNRYVEEGREYCLETRLMFEKCKAGILKPFTSDYVVEELSRTTSSKRETMLKLIVDYEIPIIEKDKNAESLADKYVDARIVPARNKMDGIHIAMATLYAMDCIVSLNFKHINKITVKAAVEALNLANDYAVPFICTPMEVNYIDEK